MLLPLAPARWNLAQCRSQSLRNRGNRCLLSVRIFSLSVRIPVQSSPAAALLSWQDHSLQLLCAIHGPHLFENKSTSAAPSQQPGDVKLTETQTLPAVITTSPNIKLNLLQQFKQTWGFSHTQARDSWASGGKAPPSLSQSKLLLQKERSVNSTTPRFTEGEGSDLPLLFLSNSNKLTQRTLKITSRREGLRGVYSLLSQHFLRWDIW